METATLAHSNLIHFGSEVSDCRISKTNLTKKEPQSMQQPMKMDSKVATNITDNIWIEHEPVGLQVLT